MAVDSPKGDKVMLEEWMVDTIGSAGNGVAWLTTGDSGDTVFARAAARGSLTAQGATAATDDNMVEIGHDLLWMRAQDGHLWMEARVQLDVITNVAFNIGFNDDQSEDSNTLPMELSTTTFTSNAATWIGFVFDVDATNDDVHAMWVDDDSDSTEAIGDLRFTGLSLVAARWFTFRVDLWDRGSGNGVRADFMVVEDSTGRGYHKVFNTNVDRDALLTPHIAFENRSGTAHVFDIDYIEVGKSRS